MNNKFFIATTILVSIILIFLFLFKNPYDSKDILSWNIWKTEASFSYSWVIENLSWSMIAIKLNNWISDNFIINSSTVIKWIEWINLTINEIKKWFTIEVIGSIRNKIKTIKKLIVIKEENIIIDSPVDNIELTSPIIIKWEARAFENTINYVILDSSWRTISQWIWNIDSINSSKFWKYTIKAIFRKPKTSTGSIEVFEISEKDGSITNSAKVNIKFWIKTNWNWL